MSWVKPTPGFAQGPGNSSLLVLKKEYFIVDDEQAWSTTCVSVMRCWVVVLKRTVIFNTLRLIQNGQHFTDSIFKCIFFIWNIWISNDISLTFVPKHLINNIPALVQITAWRHQGDKPLSEPMIVGTKPLSAPMMGMFNWCIFASLDLNTGVFVKYIHRALGDISILSAKGHYKNKTQPSYLYNGDLHAWKYCLYIEIGPWVKEDLSWQRTFSNAFLSKKSLNWNWTFMDVHFWRSN